jgi:arsenate reductase
MILYQYPKCSTCRKAVNYLKAQGVEFDAIDITEQPPTKEELLMMLENYQGEIRKLFNTSGVQYRELNLKAKLPDLTTGQAIDLLSGNGKLIKRPFILTSDNRGFVGFKEMEWSTLL